MERGRTAAKMLMEHPERLAAAWRRELWADRGRDDPPENLLDGLAEPFIHELGRSLAGERGPAWSRTRGVLRLSLRRGTRALYAEFGALRRCLLDAVCTLGAAAPEVDRIAEEIDCAVDASVALYRRLSDEGSPQPNVAFGGLVLELFERPAPARPALEDGVSATVLHG